MQHWVYDDGLLLAKLYTFFLRIAGAVWHGFLSIPGRYIPHLLLRGRPNFCRHRAGLGGLSHIFSISVSEGMCCGCSKMSSRMVNDELGGGNSNIFGMFTPKIGEDEPVLTNILTTNQ